MPHSNLEIWKPVVGYEGLYEVSNKGRVKSLPRKVNGVLNGKQITRVTPGKILKNSKAGRGGVYCSVGLCKDGKALAKLVHRLVAEAFIPNPDNLPEVNHKDENPKNNEVSNLEWCTGKYNCNYGTRNERTGAKNAVHMKGKPSCFKGKKHSNETKEKMRIAKLGKYTGSASPNYGKKASAEARKHMSEAQKKRFQSREQLEKNRINARKGAEARWHKNA